MRKLFNLISSAGIILVTGIIFAENSGISIFGSEIVYAQDYGKGAIDQNLQNSLREGLNAKQEEMKLKLSQQVEVERSNQILLIVVIGTITIGTAVILPLLRKRLTKLK